MIESSSVAGIIGGMGPMATAYFLEMVVNMTDAECDQDHVDMIITNRCTTYDRTEYITGVSSDNPLDTLIEDAKKLERLGADVLAITCNTAHYFYEDIQNNVDIPIINIVEETIKYVKDRGYKKVCILGTKGTIYTDLYQKECEKNNLECMILNEKYQNQLMDIIYKQIKVGQYSELDKFDEINDYIEKYNCDCAILGCTELSILKNKINLDESFYIDSLEILAKAVINYCGKRVKEDKIYKRGATI